jgi:hypothetical protein
MSGNRSARCEASRSASKARERGQEAAHGRHPSGHGLQEVLQGPGAIREQVAVPLHEPVELLLGVLTAVAGLDHRVQLREHVLDPLQLLWCEVAESLRQAPEPGPQDLAGQLIRQLLEPATSLRVDEAVLAEIAEAAGEVGGERVEEGLPGPSVVVGPEGECGPLPLQDVVEPPGQVLQGSLEVEVGLLGPPSLPQPGGQRVRAGEPAPQAPPHEAAHGALGPLAGQDLLRHRLEEVPGGQVRAQRVLGPVPPRVPDPHRTSVPFGRRKEDRCPVIAVATRRTRT